MRDSAWVQSPGWTIRRPGADEPVIASVFEWLVPAIPFGVFIVAAAFVAVRTLRRAIREVRAEVRHRIARLGRSPASEIRSGTSTIRKELEKRRKQRWGLIVARCGDPSSGPSRRSPRRKRPRHPDHGTGSARSGVCALELCLIAANPAARASRPQATAPLRATVRRVTADGSVGAVQRVPRSAKPAPGVHRLGAPQAAALNFSNRTASRSRSGRSTRRRGSLTLPPSSRFSASSIGPSCCSSRRSETWTR